MIARVFILMALAIPVPVVHGQQAVADAATEGATLSRDNVMQFRGRDGTVRPVTSPQQWEQRRQSILAAMQSVMGTLPDDSKRTPPEVKTLEEVDCESYLRRRVAYRSQPESWTTAYLCIPKQLLGSDPQPAPAILCLHPTDNQVGHDVVVGLGGRANRQYASELAARGYVTLAPSYPLLADYQPQLKPLGWESGTMKAIWDNMRGIDLLQSMPIVRGDSIGAIGHSLGGHNAVYTAVFDQRIGAIVSSCGLDSYRDYYDGDRTRWSPGNGWTSQRYMPRLADYQDRLEQIPFDFAEMIAALAPRPTLIVAPLHDGNFRAASVDRVVKSARPVFELFGHSSRLRVEHPECEHDFPSEMREAAYRMFDTVLRKE
jgi:hypothetical protein